VPIVSGLPRLVSSVWPSWVRTRVARPMLLARRREAPGRRLISAPVRAAARHHGRAGAPRRALAITFFG
jgi:hypothetical protein